MGMEKPFKLLNMTIYLFTAAVGFARILSGYFQVTTGSILTQYEAFGR